jgi:hypothetical protein
LQADGLHRVGQTLKFVWIELAVPRADQNCIDTHPQDFRLAHRSLRPPALAVVSGAVVVSVVIGAVLGRGAYRTTKGQKIPVMTRPLSRSRWRDRPAIPRPPVRPRPCYWGPNRRPGGKFSFSIQRKSVGQLETTPMAFRSPNRGNFIESSFTLSNKRRLALSSVNAEALKKQLENE